MSVKLNIYLEERFIHFNNSYYSMVYDDLFWDRYLEVFNKVYVVARVYDVDLPEKIPNGYKEVTRDRVEFLRLPYYQGLYAGIVTLPILFIELFKIVKSSKNNILRLPGIISIFAGIFCSIFKKKFAVELVGDPYDVFSSGVGGKLSKILRFIFTGMTKILVKNAIAVAYVTQRTMQLRYPTNKSSFSTYYSSITLDKNVFQDKNIRKKINKEDFKILMVGSLEQMYKGFDIAIKAIARVEFKENVKVNIVGDGVFRNQLQEIANHKNMNNSCIFHGKMSREQIFNLMEEVDLFLMPSRTEGLPRALIEAMSKGLPAIGSDVGGIPELLSEEWIFKSEDDLALSQKISKIYYLESVEEISMVNMEKAKEFQSDILQERRKEFYSVLKNS